MAVLGAVVVGLGIWAFATSGEADELATATDLVEEWGEAWSGLDPEALVDLYTADGVHIPPSDWIPGEARGQDSLRMHASRYVDAISDVSLTGEVVAIGDSRYTVPIEFGASGDTWVADVRFEVNDDLLSRTEMLNTKVKGT